MRLFLLDALAILFRSYYAFLKKPIYNSKGMNTSAIFGFANTLLDLIKTEKPTHIAVAFDSETPTHRETDYTFYKANRPPTPEDLLKSIPYAKLMTKLMNIPAIEVPGYEADDVIGTIAHEAEKNHLITYIVSPDKDFGQLVSSRILLYKPSSSSKEKEIWDVQRVCDRYGIEQPIQLIDILALMGDPSDNIPGVHGIGEKTAINLIRQFRSIEELYQHLESISSPSLRKKLEENKDLAFLSKQLATIQLNVPLELRFSELEWKIPSFQDLQPFFEELEFKTFSKRFWETIQQLSNEKPSLSRYQPTLFDQEHIPVEQRSESFASIHSMSHEYELIQDPEQLKIWLQQVKDILSIDLETTSLDPFSAEVVGIALSFKPHKACFVDTKNNPSIFLETLKPYLQSSSILIVGHNLKFDLSILKKYKIDVTSSIFDTMIAHYLLDPEKKHGLDFLSEVYLQYKTISYDEMMNKKKDIREVPPELIRDYACEDADIALQLYQTFDSLLKEKELIDLFYQVEIPLIKVLMDMELTGVKINTEELKEISVSLQKDIVQIENEIFELAGKKFNLNSPKQLGEILFEDLKIDANPPRTKTRQYSTSEEVLQKYTQAHPIVNKILDYRELVKLKNTYVDALPQLIHSQTGKIHTSFNQTITSTGRLSSSNPNLQNIPIRTTRGKEIRKVFIPKQADYCIISADYNQIELRIMASMSGDENMIKAFENDKDIHSMTAARLFNVDEAHVTPEMRRIAKTVNFGIIYGMSPFGLAERLGIPRSEAKKIIDSYFKEFPGIKKYMEDAIAFAREHGYVQTLLKRRRYLPDINSTNPTVRGYAERNAINMPIQGTAADMMKLAMIQIHKFLTEKYPETKIILQIHDELVFEAPEKDAEEVMSSISTIMKNALPLAVPINVSIQKGKNWLEAHN
ncbi:MAG: DNA polymerase I [Bacteroidales bacterium]|nr:DNA polymerase I [Bacteroidales bacterium]